MRTSNDARSSRSDEEHNEPASPMRNRQDDTRSRSQRSVKSSRNDEEETRNVKYNDQQQAELLRKLDSIKGHLIRGGNAKDSDQGRQMGGHFHGHGPHGHGPSYYNNAYPDQFDWEMYPNPGYRDPYGYGRHHGLIRGHHQMQPRPPQYHQPQGGQYVDIGADILDPHIQDPRFFPVTPSRYGDVPYSPQGGVHHKRRPSEVKSETGGGAFARGYVQKGAMPDFDTRRCRPLGGGAPFIACHSCFELLYLPKKKLLARGKEHKLECGACAEVITFTIDDKKIVFASSPLAETTTNLVSQDVSVTTAVVVEEETKVVVPSRGSDSEESSSISSEPRKEVKSVRSRATKATPPPPPPDSNLLTLFEYSNIHRAALDYGMSQLGYDKEKPYGIQDSLKLPCYNKAVATEVSDNGYYNNTESTEEYSRISTNSEEENKPTSRRKESSEYSSTEVHANKSDEQLEVWVNGHLIPEDMVISAEKQAGPVQAGNYWYDYRAGFWGVMGHPCLGIIPPFIEEFSHPMPDNCGAGNTSVYVNGRDLHERDLELLARRGLPREKKRSYVVDISGRVLDGDSGEELKSLGKLAPTIEKVKHGFGMRVPRSLAS